MNNGQGHSFILITNYSFLLSSFFLEKGELLPLIFFKCEITLISPIIHDSFYKCLDSIFLNILLSFCASLFMAGNIPQLFFYYPQVLIAMQA